MHEFPYQLLRRFPDVEAANLFAADATDRLLVQRGVDLAVERRLTGTQVAVVGDEYGAITLALTDAGLEGVRVHQDLVTGRRALANNARALGLAGFVPHELGPDLFRGVRLVLLQLPKALAELEEIADAVARWAAPDAVLVAGGRVKHMTLAQNEVLARSFARVQAERAERKSRLVVAAEPLAVPSQPPFPVCAAHPEYGGLVLCAQGAAFAGARVDIGTRALLDALGLGRPGPAAATDPRPGSVVTNRGPDDESRRDPRESLRETSSPPGNVGAGGPGVPNAGPGSVVTDRGPDDESRRDPRESLRETSSPPRNVGGPGVGTAAADTPGVATGPGTTSGIDPGGAPVVVDLGCGTGALAASFALAHPAARVIATDRSAAAVASARATMVANGIADRVRIMHDDAGSELPDASVDIVLLNPPFHLGTSVHTGAASRLFAASARLLRPGGELWTVYNSALGYRGELHRIVGETEQILRTPKFTVTRSIRRD